MLNRIGEVIEASTGEFLAQCYELEEAPPFGSLVKTLDGATEVYAIVYNAETASIDPERRPLARGKDEAEEADIFRHNPQLGKLLRTNFSALVLGHRPDYIGGLYHRLPPRPARIHSFVYLCDAEEVRQFTRSLDFLALLLNARVPASVEELIAACLRRAAEAHEESLAFLVAAGKELALLLGGQLNRLDAILRRIKP